MSVLVAAITNGRTDSTLAFCTMLLKLQGTAGTSPGTNLTIQFFGTKNDALTFFLKNTSFDVIVCIDTWKACDPRFILDPPPEGMPFVVGAYPLPSIDWNRVKTSIATSAEAPHLVGHAYNISCSPDDNRRERARYVPITSAELGIFKMRRCVLEDIVAMHGHSVLASNGKVCIATDEISRETGEVLSGDQRVCALWGKGVYADLEASCTSFGPVGYMGCVGLRNILR